MTSLRLRSLALLALSFAFFAGCASPTPEHADSGRDSGSEVDAAQGSDAATDDDAAVTPDAGGRDTGSSPDSGPEFAGSFIRRSCGPADGPAFQLDLFQA